MASATFSPQMVHGPRRLTRVPRAPQMLASVSSVATGRHLTSKSQHALSFTTKQFSKHSSGKRQRMACINSLENDVQLQAEVTTKCFFEVEIGGEPCGKIVMGLYGDVVPKTVDYFRALCTGEKGFGFKGCYIDPTIEDLIIREGNVTVGDGTGGKIYGYGFRDEDFSLKHVGPGVLGIALVGSVNPFVIRTAKAPWFDGHCVVFGQVIDGMDVLKELDAVGRRAWEKVSLKMAVSRERPREIPNYEEVKPCRIINCGELPLDA